MFVHTSPFRPGPQYSRSITVPLRRPTADSSLLVQSAVIGLRAIYKAGYQLIKAGVMLLDLQSDAIKQSELDLEGDSEPERIQLMSTLDTLNQRFGRGTVAIASSGMGSSSKQNDQRVWAMKQQRRTPQYTTRWTDVPVARA